MQKFVRPADRWIIAISLLGVIALGTGWHTESLWQQLIGYLTFGLTTKLIKDRYSGWRALLHADLYLMLSALLFVFS